MVYILYIIGQNVFIANISGFAELQVEIVDFVQAAETNTIPFTDYQTYVVKLLFSRNQFVDFLSLPPNVSYNQRNIQDFIPGFASNFGRLNL